MKLTYDKEADALYVRFSEEKIKESEEARPGMIVDFDKDGRIVGIELISVKEQFTPQAIANLQAA
jgi:uncharacterized protein YuzE